MGAKTGIRKRGRGHSYTLDGAPVKGVTTILGAGIPKAALQGWAARTTAEFAIQHLRMDDDGRVIADGLIDALRKVNAEAPRWAKENLDGAGVPLVALSKVLSGVRFRDRDQAARRGAEVHGIAERLADGEEVEVPSELEGHIDSYVQFLNDWAPANATLEAVVVNRRWGYMGKLDMVAEFPGRVWSDGPHAGEPVGRGLLDIKTSRSGIFAEVALQLEAYAHAETYIPGGVGDEEPMPSIDWVGAIWVRADGYDVYSFDRGEAGDGAETFRTFLYAKQIGEWFAKDGPSDGIRSDALRPPKQI